MTRFALFEIYGIVDAGQDAAEGLYGDSLRVAVMP